LIYGGAGQLGSALVSAFKKANWETFCVDVRKNDEATQSIQISGSSDVKNDTAHVLSSLSQHKASLDVIICVAGGWAGGNVASDDIFETTERMWKLNIQSALSSSHVASRNLKEGGKLILTGAAAALAPNPGSIGYQITKAGTHALLFSLAAENSGLPKGATVHGIAPLMLDTATNRQAMPNANYDNWTPLPTVAQLLVDWSNGKDVPKNGSLVKIVTENKETKTISVDSH